MQCIGIALLMISIVVQSYRKTLAKHWDCIAYDKHCSAMHWDCIAYDKHSCAMHWDCFAYDKHSCAMH